MQTATNPKTGETAVLVGNEWKKAESIATNDKGDKAYLVGGSWMTDSGKSDLPSPAETTVSGVASEGAKGLVRGAGMVGGMMGEGAARAFLGPFGNLGAAAFRATQEPAMNLVKATPNTPTERFVGTGAEIIGGGAVTGGLSSAPVAAMTIASGLTGATGEQMFGEAGKLAALVPAAIQFGVTLARNIPKNMLAKSIESKLSTDYAKRGKEISEKTSLSLGQETGDEAIMLIEGMAAKNPFSAQEFQKFGAKQTGESIGRLQKIMDSITPEKIGDVKAGIAISGTFDDAVKNAVSLRSKQAASDFAAVDAAAGRDPMVLPVKLMSKIDELIQDFNVPGGGDASSALVSRLQSIKESLQKTGTLTAQQTNRLLQVYGNASRGTGQVFKDLDSAQQRRIAASFTGSLLDDIDSSIASGGAESKAASLLKTARDNYRANSQGINALEESVLGKYLGTDRSPERVAEFMGRLKPTELHQAISILNKANPEVVLQVRRHVIERAMEEAVLAPSKRNPSAPNFSAAKFIDAMPEGPKFEVLFGSSNARGELKSVSEALERIAYRGFTEGSPTAPLMMAWDAAKRLFTIQGLVGLPAAVLAPKVIAKAALTPEGRRALITLGRYDAPNQSTIRAASYLVALSSAEQKTQEQPTASTEGTAITK